MIHTRQAPMESRFFLVLATLAGIFFLTLQPAHADTLADTYKSKAQKNFSTRGKQNDFQNYDRETLTKDIRNHTKKTARKDRKYKNPRKNRRDTRGHHRKKSTVNTGVNE